MSVSIISHPTARRTLRSVSMTALIGLTLLAGQSLTAQAQNGGPVPNGGQPQTKEEGRELRSAVAGTAKRESVEDRIASLHDSLKITAAEDGNWKAVADVMRANAAAMEKLVADKATKGTATLTAVDDLKNYELFAQAHVTGLKKLITAFDTLYTGMSPDQKKTADQIFENSRHEQIASHG